MGIGLKDLIAAFAVGGSEYAGRKDQRAEREQEQRLEADRANRERERDRELLRYYALRNQDLAQPPKPKPYKVSVGGVTSEFATPEEADEFRKRFAVPENPDEINWQYDATRGVQINPRTGEVRTPQGLPARPGTPTPERGTPEYLEMIAAEEQARAGARGPSAVDARAGRDVRAMLGDLDDVATQLEAYPEGVGKKGFLPDIVLQRTDPQGVRLRASLANVASAITLMRSGGAVSDAEFARLEAFLPKDTDTVEALKTKLDNLRAFFERKAAELSGTSPTQVPDGAVDRSRMGSHNYRPAPF